MKHLLTDQDAMIAQSIKDKKLIMQWSTIKVFFTILTYIIVRQTRSRKYGNLLSTSNAGKNKVEINILVLSLKRSL